jgi:hypothetical protein
VAATSRQNFDVPAKNYNTKKASKKATSSEQHMSTSQTMANVSVRAPWADCLPYCTALPLKENSSPSQPRDKA